MTITATPNDYYQVTARGVEYTARVNVLGRWEVHSRRVALGPRSFGSVRHFDTAAQVAAAIRAFRTLPLFLQMAA